jgi:hypothetical protein
MYGELYQYFIRHKNLSLPGIGTFYLERIPASSDFPNRIINPPSFNIALQAVNVSPSKAFFKWLAESYSISERDAVIRFNDFAFSLKQELANGKSIEWNGMGVLSPGLAGEIKFDPALNGLNADVPVKAEKVIRDKAEHTVRVGEDERTSAQMIEMLNQRGPGKNYWWAWALALAIIIIMFLGWYFSAYGLQLSSSGNNLKAEPTTSGQTYKVPEQ